MARGAHQALFRCTSFLRVRDLFSDYKSYAENFSLILQTKIHFFRVDSPTFLTLKKLDSANFVRKCDDGFEKIPGDDDYCYRKFMGDKNRQPWQEVQKDCHVKYGAHLFEIFSDQQQKSVDAWLASWVALDGENYKGPWLGIVLKSRIFIYSYFENV